MDLVSRVASRYMKQAEGPLVAPPWWTASPFSSNRSVHEMGVSWAYAAFNDIALRGGPPVYRITLEGHLVVPIEDFLRTIVAISQCRLIHKRSSGGESAGVFLASPTMAIEVDFSGEGKTTYVTLATNDGDTGRKLVSMLQRGLKQDPPSDGPIYTLAKGMAGYSVTKVGVAGSEIIRENYAPEVLSAYDHALSDLRSATPCGRLIIFSGQPGTGKTFLVRSILGSVPRATFVLIPGQLIKEMGGPDILPVFSGLKEGLKGPIVLVAEDGDMALVNRESGNMDSISTLLNLGDGILGSVLDIRVMLTTNARKLEMDPATMRKGRLCRHIEVGPLSPAQAKTIFVRLAPGKRPPDFGDSPTLTEVYSAARDHGWVPPVPKNRR